MRLTAMKLLYLLISLFVPAFLSAQSGQITFKQKGAAGQMVRVLSPVDGRFFWGDLRTEMLDSAGTLVLENRETVPGVFTFYCNGSYSLYVRPGENYALITDPGNEQDPLRVEAADAEGQLQLNALSQEFYQTAGTNLYQADTSFIRNKARIQASLDSVVHRFRVLNEKKRIDRGFLNFAIAKSKAYYAAVLGATLIRPTQQLVFEKDSSAYREEVIRTIEQQWEQLRDLCDVFDLDNTGPGAFIDYTNLYNMWYLGYIKGKQDGTFRQFETEDAYDRFQYDNIRRYYEGPLAEYLCASHLAYLLVEERFKPGIQKEYDAFTAQFPGSLYTGYMEPGMQRILAYRKKSTEDFSPAQRLLPGYDSLRTFKELTAQFPDKTIFMDLWATWCSPCKEEFAYNEELRAFLDAKGIIPMYISIDREQDDQRWKDMIKYYDLKGYHLRAGPALMEDLRRLFGSEGVLSIPRYALIKNGELIAPRMRAPSDKEMLYEQITEYTSR